MIVLDTDIFVDFMRGSPEAIRFFDECTEDITFSAITEAELLSGKVCVNPQKKENVFHLLSQFEKIPVGNPLVQVAGDFWRKYGIEVPDAIIAATAFITGSILFTRNLKDFERVREIKVEKPY